MYEILRSLSMKKIKTLSIQDIANTEGCQEELFKYVDSQDIFDVRTKEFGISYSSYITVQNILSVLFEYFFNEDRFDSEFIDILEKAIDIYMPDGPPVSPLTKTYFSYWSFVDARYKKGKTFAEYILKNIKALQFPKDWTQPLENLSASRMGIYEHLGFTEDKKIILGELVTENEICTINAAGYRGKRGDLCLVRVVLPLASNDTNIIVTTPYILCGHSKQNWIDYFKRQGIYNGDAEMMNKFMKNWPSNYYWHEFIFQAYLGYESSHIYLKGMPDIRGTKPHEM
jgi:hypothetical protein